MLQNNYVNYVLQYVTKQLDGFNKKLNIDCIVQCGDLDNCNPQTLRFELINFKIHKIN